MSRSLMAVTVGSARKKNHEILKNYSTKNV
jgi:hypothetical protein